MRTTLSHRKSCGAEHFVGLLLHPLTAHYYTSRDNIFSSKQSSDAGFCNVLFRDD